LDHIPANDMSFSIRPMTHADCQEVVSVHIESFPGFFLTFLGPAFLHLLYVSICKSTDSVALVAECDKGKILGFVVGVSDQVNYYRNLIALQKWRFARAALMATIRKPSIIPRLIRALKHPKEVERYAAKACLLSIAVRPQGQGLGVGKQLIRDFCDELANRGVKSVCLTTDRDSNEKVNSFYRRLGFKLVRSYTTPEGRRMNEYKITLRDA